VRASRRILGVLVVAILAACTSEVPDEFCRAASRVIEIVEESPTAPPFDSEHGDVLGELNDNMPPVESEAFSPAVELGAAYADWFGRPSYDTGEELASRAHSQAEAFVQEYC
jgi:hypothetical protein